MIITDRDLRASDIPVRGASFVQIAAFADTLPSDGPSSPPDAGASAGENGEWEGTLGQLRRRLQFDVRAIHHMTDNDPTPADMDLLYSLLDAMRTRLAPTPPDARSR